jgi:hypothetical protein
MLPSPALNLGARLTDRAAYLRKDRIRVRADQAHGADDDHKDHGQHDRVLRDVLPVLILPKLLKKLSHRRSP